MSGGAADAAQWRYHPAAVNGWLTVYGTVDCQIEGDPLFERTYVYVCNNYTGWIPPEYNDYLIRFERDASNGGTNWHKYAVPTFNPDVLRWRLRPFAGYIEANLAPDAGVILPCLGDSVGAVQTIYVMVNLEVWLTDPRTPLGTYTIVDGECPDLPGYMIGTTPIAFDSTAGPTENPFSTTAFNGELYLDGDLTFDPTPIPMLTHWGMAVLVVLLLLAATRVFIRRKKAPA
jgi:hypothetical protein